LQSVIKIHGGLN